MIHAFDIGGTNCKGDYPDECPICHHYGNMILTGMAKVVDEYEAEVIYKCPYPECLRFFIGRYKIDGSMLRDGSFQPSKPEDKAFPEIIGQVSQDFLTIYGQAAQAKSLGLDQIAGPGYRKAFEFLIKDYAISKSDEEQHDEIRESFSGKVVEKYIEDQRIQRVANRALWLGNDESHYLRKWKEHDIEDLLTLIQLTVNWIETEKLSEKYEKSMPDDQEESS